MPREVRNIGASVRARLQTLSRETGQSFELKNRRGEGAEAIDGGAFMEDCAAWDEADSERQAHQDQSGRLWDVLFMAAYAARANANAGSELLFEPYHVPRDGRATEAELTTLKLVVGPGDGGEPVMTILLPNED